MREIKVFVSSPGDAQFERRRLERVVERLNGELSGSILLRTVRWETSFYSAHETFQSQIPPAAECDIVVAILRHRLGTELPADFPRMPDGSPYPSGTAYEVLTAIEARRTRELPDVYVFRYAEPPQVSLDDPAARSLAETQWSRLKGFFERWFLSPEGQFKAAFHVFASTDEFEDQAERLLRQWIEDHVLKDRSVVWPIEIKGSPFRGLDAFDARHAPVFFGRRRDTARAVDALKDGEEAGTAFLLIVGASGAGKSSLARAGVAPRLTAPGVVPAVDVWRVAMFRPGERAGDPFLALAEALLSPPASADTTLRALPELAAGPYPTPRQLADFLKGADDPQAALLPALDSVAEEEQARGGFERAVRADILVVVDQLDDLFAEDIPEDDRIRFGAVLGALARSGRIWVAATLRADLYERYVTVPELLRLKSEGRSYDLASPGEAELDEIVRGPAEAAALVYEADVSGRTLDERLLADAGRADMLPLLQFTLNRLFEERVVVEGATHLTHAAYDALGGLTGAIDLEAERAIAPLGERAVSRLPRLLRDLARPAAGDADAAAGHRLTIRSVPLQRAVHDAEAGRLVEALVNARILLAEGTGNAATVRIAHQRVLEAWGRARATVAENSDFFRIRQEVEDERQRWEDGGRRRDRLIRPGVPLAEAESIARRFRDELSPETRTFIAASGNRARLRQRLVAGAAIVFLGVAVAAAYLGWRANVAEDRAQRNYLTARNTVDTIVFDVAQGLRKVEGVRIESIRTILQEVQKAVDELAQSTPNEAGLFRSRATMMMLFGDVYMSAGDGPAGLKAYEESLAATRILAAEYPGDLDPQRDLLVSLVRVADAKSRMGDAEGTIAGLREALGVAHALTEAEPDNVLWQRDLAMVLERMGDFQTQSGDTPGAFARFDESLAAARRALAIAPQDSDAQEDLAVVLENVGDLRQRVGQTDEARTAFEESLDLRRALLAADPGLTERQRAVSVALVKLGDLMLQTGDISRAADSYRESAGVLRHLSSLDPENTRPLGDLAILENKLGDVSLRTGDFAAARSSYQVSLDTDRRLAELEPSNTEWQRSLAVDLNRMGDLAARTGDVDGALASYREARAIIEKLVKLDPDNIGWQRDLNFGLGKIADAEGMAGNLSGSLAAYETMLANARRLLDREPQNVEWRSDVALALERLGDARLRMGDAAAAKAAFEEARGQVRDLIAQDPTNQFRQSQMSILTQKTGDVALRRGDAAAALAAYDESLGIDRRLVEADPEDLPHRRGLAVSLNRVADVKRQTGDADAALAAYQESLDIARDLTRRQPQNTQYLSDVAFSLNRIADLKLAAGDTETALRNYDEALVIARQLSAAAPGVQSYRDAVALALQRIGDVKAARNDLSGALQTYEEELSIRRASENAEAADVTARRNLAMSLQRIGDVKTRQGDQEAALASYRETAAALEGLAATDPEQVFRKSDLVQIYARLAQVIGPARRREYLARALAIAEELKAAGRLTEDQKSWPDDLRKALGE